MTTSKRNLWTSSGVKLRWLLGLGLVVITVMFVYWVAYSSSVGSQNPLNGVAVFLIGIPFFPEGIAKLAGLTAAMLNLALNANNPLVGLSGIALWLIYVILPIAVMAIKRKRVSLVLYLALVVLLVANMAGCVMMTPDIMNIH